MVAAFVHDKCLTMIDDFTSREACVVINGIFNT